MQLTTTGNTASLSDYLGLTSAQVLELSDTDYSAAREAYASARTQEACTARRQDAIAYGLGRTAGRAL